MLEDPGARATIDMQDDSGLTALRLACSQNDPAVTFIIVQLLLESGADPSLANDHGETALAWLQSHRPSHHATIALLEQAME